MWADAGPVSKKCSDLDAPDDPTPAVLVGLDPGDAPVWQWKANVCPRTDAPDDSTPIEALQAKAVGQEAPIASGTSITLGGSHPVYCVEPRVF